MLHRWKNKRIRQRRKGRRGWGGGGLMFLSGSRLGLCVLFDLIDPGVKSKAGHRGGLSPKKRGKGHRWGNDGMCWDAIGQKGRLCQPLPWLAAQVKGCVVGGRPGRGDGLWAGCPPPSPLLLPLHQAELPGLHQSGLPETWERRTFESKATSYG